MKLSKPILIFLNKNQIRSFEKTGPEWNELHLSGETLLECSTDRDYKKALELVNDIHNSKDGLKNVQLFLIVHEVSPQHIEVVVKKILKLECEDWQLFKLSLLSPFLPEKYRDDDLENTDWIQSHLLPLMGDDQKNIGLPSGEESENAAQTLEKQIENLKAQKRALEVQLQALRGPNIEMLITYMPALYQNFWGSIRPDELALLAGTLQVPEIASPYKEPSEDTLMTLKERLWALPSQEKERMRQFCKSLHHKLKVRPEMKAFFKKES